MNRQETARSWGSRISGRPAAYPSILNRALSEDRVQGDVVFFALSRSIILDRRASCRAA
jgi:hypothetical protein